jgi:hypothetical protein
MIIYSNTRSKKKKIPKKQLADYQQFLDNVNKMKLPSGNNVVKKTLVRKSKLPVLSIPEDRTPRKYASVDSGVTGACGYKGVMKDYQTMSESDRKIVDHVASCVAPLHKSNLVYVTSGMNPAGLGRKNEVL